jgi:putative tryptophan/tyrosine transport system substrate-binding protein
MMRRREFIAGIGGTAAWPLVAGAQQPPTPVIGFLSSVGPADAPAMLAAFHKGLGEAGYFENKNLVIEYRWAENKNDRLPALARDLVEHHVVAIGAFGTPHQRSPRKQLPRSFPSSSDLATILSGRASFRA